MGNQTGLDSASLHRLKVQHCNYITAELDKFAKDADRMMKYYAIEYMESGKDSSKVSYEKEKAKQEVIAQAIRAVQSASQRFTFKD